MTADGSSRPAAATRLVGVIVFALGLGAVAVYLWNDRGGSPPGQPAPTATAPSSPAQSLLIVTVDTLRADRVGAFGYTGARTPTFDAVARAGVRFDAAFAPAPITLVSHASLLTGLNPPAHRARHNGMPTGAEVPTLATVLGAAGFQTGAFVSAFPLDRRFGLARGFETYDDGLPRGADGRLRNERPGATTVDAAIAWLASRRGSRVFLWVHLFEPHAPYGDPAAAAGQGTLAQRYDAEVAEADRQIARLIEALGSDRNRTLVVLTSDHGEAFGEHGEVGHSIFVYDTTLRVPLVVAGPGVPADGRAIASTVGLIDVAPTVLGLLDVKPLDGDGVDLRRVMDGTAAASAARPLYAESFAPLYDFGWSPLQSLRDGRWKYMQAPRPELYDVAADAAETRDVISEQAAEATRLSSTLARLAPPNVDAAASSDPEAAARLGSLGYVSGRRQTISGPRPDPKDRREVASRLAEVTSGEVPPDRLVDVLEGLLRDDPGNPQASLRLGVALSERGECARAEPRLKDAIANGLPSADPFISLAFCYRARRDAAAAGRALTEALRLDGNNTTVLANLGLLAFDEERMPDAIRFLQQALTRDADLHEVRFVLARALARVGEREAARREASTLLSRLPASAPQRSEVERLLRAIDAMQED